MFGVAIFCVLAGSAFDLVQGMGPSMIDYGIWEVKDISYCPDPEQYTFQIGMEKHKYNHTHVIFDASLILKAVLDSDFGVNIKICKWVDGGCKDYSTLTDENVIEFMMKMAEENTRKAMEIMGIPDFPVEPGEYQCEGYLIDYCEFPCKCVLGLFEAKTMLLNKNNEVQACIIVTVEFRVPDDDEEMCEKCQED